MKRSLTKKPTVNKLKKKLDAVFSLYIRTRDGGKCFTCGKVGEIKTMQAGHYVSRSHMSLRYNEVNVNCQCMPCNVFKHGAMDEYAIMLQLRHGKEILASLNKWKHEQQRFTVQQLEQLIEHYKNRTTS